MVTAGSLKVYLPVVIALSILIAPLNSPAWQAGAKPSATKKSKPAAGQTSAPVSASPQSGGRADGAPQTVQQLELRLFFKNYADDPVDARIARIEKQIFGQTIEATEQERLSRLDQFLQEKLAQERETQQQQQPQTGTAYGAGQRNQNQSMPGASDEDEIERARQSIQAAREEEIAGLLAEGVHLYRKKQGMRAQEKFEQVLRLDPQNAQAHFNLGIIEETMGNYVEALASYQQAAAREPENSEYTEAVKAVQQKAAAQAKVAGQRADLRALAESANAAWKRGEYISALDLYQQLDRKEPNRALVKYNIGSIYVMLKDPHSALEFYRQAAKLEPSSPKYSQAYRTLSAQIEKEQEEQAKIEKEARVQWQGAQAPPQNNAAKSTKGNKKAARTSAKQTPQAPSAGGNAPIYGSNFAPYAVMGGTQGLPGMPTQQQSAPQYAQNQAAMQRANQQAVSQGRPAFGVMPGMQSALQTRQPQAATQLPVQQRGADILSQIGLIVRENGEGVTVTNVGIASRAASAGFFPGDDIRAVDGVQITTPADIGSVLSRRNPAQRIPFVILRNGNLTVLNL